MSKTINKVEETKKNVIIIAIPIVLIIFALLIWFFYFNNNIITKDKMDYRFDDINFYNCVKNALGSDGIKKDGYTLDDDKLLSLTELNCDNNEIYDATGLSYIENLKILSLKNNKLSDIDMTKNQKLESLDLSNNNFSIKPFECIQLGDNCEFGYIANFNSDKGSGVDNQNVFVVTKPEDPVKTGYRFLGWYYNDELYDFDKELTSDIELVAKWERLSLAEAAPSQTTISLTYKCGDNSCSNLPSTVTVPKPSSGTIPINISSVVPTSSNNAVFLYWTNSSGTKKYKSNCSGLSNCSTKISISVNNTLYAVWKGETYTVKFNDNNGSYGNTSSVSATYGKAMPTISFDDAPTRKGYKFMGWYDKPNYQEGNRYYTEYCQSDRLYDKKSNITLYAGWKSLSSLSGSALTNFKNSNNINSNSNIIALKDTGKIGGYTINLYYVYNKNTFSKLEYHQVMKFTNHTLNYASRVNSKIVNFLKNHGMEIVIIGQPECDNSTPTGGGFIYAAYCNSQNHQIVIGFHESGLNNSYNEGSIIHEMGHDYDIILRNVLSGETQVGLTGLTSSQILNGYNVNGFYVSLSILQNLFLFNSNGSPYTWNTLAKNYAVPLKRALEDFSSYSNEELSNSGLEFYAESFNAYFWDSQHRQKLKSTSPNTYNALVKTFSYVGIQ